MNGVDLLHGFQAILTLQNLTFILLGVVAGLLVGSLPGLTATMAVATLIPVSSGLATIPAFALLVSVYTGAVSGGAVTAILINTPGTPASVATAFDGYPLARQGRAAEALGWAMLASIVGTLLSITTLVLLAPAVSRVALGFSPSEYFALALLGLTLVVRISGKDTLKGIIAAILGLMIGMVGLDPLQGVPRFTFQQRTLLGGVPFIPVLIGLFAFSEILYQAVHSHGSFRVSPVATSRFPGLRQLLAHRWLVLKSAVLGTFIGALPGTGASIASLAAYNEAKRTSKEPGKFGSGAIEGVIASETANNAVIGGAMIPLLTLAIPGDDVTAILLGAFRMHGLRPGPLLFDANRYEVYAIFAAMILATILLRLVALPLIPLFTRVLSVQSRYLLSGVLLFAFVGAFALGNNTFDMAIALAFGVVGLLMKRYGYPVAPMVLALILGPLVEEKMRQALVMSAGDWSIFVTRPLTLALLLLAVLSLTLSLIQQARAIR